MPAGPNDWTIVAINRPARPTDSPILDTASWHSCGCSAGARPASGVCQNLTISPRIAATRD